MKLTEYFATLKIRQKVLVAPVLAALAFLLIQVIDYRANSAQEQLLRGISEGYFPALENSRELRETMAQIQRTLQDAVAAQDPDRLDEAKELWNGLSELLDVARTNPVRDPAAVDRLDAILQEYFDLAMDVSRRLINQETGEDLITDLQTMTSRYKEARDSLDAGMASDDEQIGQAFATTLASQQRARILNLLVALTCVALLVPATLWVIRSITRPLATLLGVAEQLSIGDLTVSIPEFRGTDELARLQSAFGSMAEGLRTVLGNVSSSVRELSTSATEISATAQQAASTSSQQASTAAEVSTSVEEIQQTSKSATEQASEVVTVAEDALDKGQQGQEAIATAVEVMHIIGERVGGLAGKILELNEKNAEIGKIVETVNDLAEQSNLLAVNASIEAAKAGEHGRGFAVVASEVRSLASQSKLATQQIGGLLSEIRSASEATVMATEEARKRTDDGQRSIESVRLVVEELANVLEVSADRARQIAGATSQQAAGITQIAEAMESVAEGSSDSARGAKQLEESALHLSSLAEQLRQTTGAFTI